MTRDDIKRMALEAGFPAASYPSLVSDTDWEALERFFKAAYAAGAAAEREACARVCENPDLLMNSTFQGVAEAIRARGQA